ncbi:hypothetical protein PENTCL1PPCAC_13703 [Pristionchus entomophagus]|uniref:Uncharacterized protein n=1 Tax=Pristionchus entomophagus TaxID=358040 RepID=A0AAV5TES8_9BILA|nr:hypothetical protein PENTCL1PPCAC_13703 [Pristionchus entomophagus]
MRENANFSLANSRDFIAKFKNKCWVKQRIESMIRKVIERDRDANIAKRAEDMIDILSNWHTTCYYAEQRQIRCDFKIPEWL